MKEKVLHDINRIYKNGYVEYILYKYIRKDYWYLSLKEYFPNSTIENLTDFNYSKCFTMCINISCTKAHIGTSEFGEYIKTNDSLDRVQLQISVLAPYATIKYVRYKLIDGKITYSDSLKPYKEKDSLLGNKIIEFLKINNLIVLGEDILSLQVPQVGLELRKENVTVYHCLFEDEY